MIQDADDFSSAGATRAIVTNLHAFADMVSVLPGAALLPVGESIGYFTSHSGALFNGVIQPRFAPSTVDADITTLLTAARDHGCGMLWWLTPGSEPANLEEQLRAHGCTRTDVLIGMAVRRDRLQVEPLPAGLSIERVTTLELLSTWTVVGCEAYGLPASFADPLAQILSADGLGEHARSTVYLAFLDGTPVATAAMAYSGGSAGIYFVATMPAVRGRGIGRAMTLTPLLAAYARGYRVGILHATAQGLAMYRRLGLHEYCAIPVYGSPGAPGITG